MDTETHTGMIPHEDGGRARNNTSENEGMPRAASSHQTLARGKERPSPRAIRESTAPPTLRFQTFGLWEGERITLIALSHPVCGSLLWQP